MNNVLENDLDCVAPPDIADIYEDDEVRVYYHEGILVL
jgi:hypothetical protein